MTQDAIARFLAQRTRGIQRGFFLRPMTSREIIDTATRAYHSLGRVILGGTVGSTILCMAVALFVTQLVIPGLFTTKSSSDLASQTTGAFISLGTTLFVGMPLFMIGVAFTSGYVTSLVSDFVLGNVPDTKAARRLALKNLPKMFRLSLIEALICASGFVVSISLMLFSAQISKGLSHGSPEAGFFDSGVQAGMISFVAFLAAIIAVPIIVARMALVPQIAILEPGFKKGLAKRSFQLLRSEPGHGSGFESVIQVMGHILVVALVGYGGVAAAASVLGIDEVFRSVPGGILLRDILRTSLTLVAPFLVLWVCVPVWCTVTTILYYDRRIRKEAFDIEALAQQVWRSDRQNRFQL